MMNLELFQVYHLKEMSLSAELFLSCSILQLTFYAISTAYERKVGFVILNQQVYYIGSLLIILALFLLLNEDLLAMNLFGSNNFIINDYLSFATKLTICITSAAFLTIINTSFRDEPIQNNFEYVVLITISVLGLLLLCSANDLITAYLAIELHSIAFYIMAAFKRDSSYSIESGLKYFIIGALSSAFFLFGSSIIYGCMGSLVFDDLRMFFSLLSLSTKTNIDLEIFPMIEGVSNVLDSSTFVSILSNNEFFTGMAQVVLPQPYLTSSDNLVDWCFLNCGSTTLPTSLTGFSGATSNGDFLVYPIFSYFITDFLTSIFTLDLIAGNKLDCGLIGFCHNIHFVNSIGSFDLLSDLNLLKNLHVEENTSLLKQIYQFYLNSSSSVLVPVDTSMLDLSFVSIGFFLICISLFIKLSIAPFHFWSLDVYEGSPNTTTFFFAVVPKISLFVLLMRLCYVSFYQIFTSNFQIYFFALAVLSIFVGSLGGIEQRKLKTLLAYSSISHTGYLLLSFSTGNIEGLQMMFYYLAIYMISGLNFWAVYLFLINKSDTYSNKNNKELGDLVLLKESNPMLAFILTMTLFSIAGIPPLVGFLIKLGVFSVAIKSSAYFVSLVSILLTVISTFYYIRLIKVLYFENTLVGKLYVPITTQKSLLIAILSFSLIILCLDPTLIYLLFYKATLLLN
uniref:NADH dehydrogenase subunit 2 n=1 Tax=Pseudo-nitzschia multiseries TaxID=37319 RepID=A0A0G3F1R7_PSEMU|nr:NADH dehydrogenase subunit 2 [Pseudo-nitzschia multiseries]AKJ77327.1 NADH dehydrogenase subunit 2 [Pseudo-nitzschia multiseries]